MFPESHDNVDIWGMVVGTAITQDPDHVHPVDFLHFGFFRMASQALCGAEGVAALLQSKSGYDGSAYPS